ncbi:reverse transcriptase domain-containing protein, partial [Tanacetum coccineum]
MKKLIAELPTLIAPMEKEELIVCLAAAREAVSEVLMKDKEAKQIPVYFVSRALQGPEINYPSMEKLILALVHASKRLKRYFKAHTIIVITDQPIKQTLFTDRSSYVDGSGAGLILTNPEGAEFTYALRFKFDATSNKAEYEALKYGLRITEQMGVKNLQTNVDSRLVANQVPRSENKKADALSKIASASFAHLTKEVLVKELNEKSINEAKVLAVMEEEGDTWMTLIYNYLTKETLPAKKERQGPYGHACQNKICGSKGHTNRILLANNAHGCKKIDNGMSRLPGSLSHAKKPAAKTDSHHVPVAILQTGIRHSRTLPGGAWQTQIPNSGNGLLYEVDRSKSRRNNNSNGDTLFSLTYGTEAVIPAKIGIPTLRTAEIDMVQNDEALEINLDLLEERMEQAEIRETRSKAKMEKYYNSKFRNTSFKPWELVYRNNDASHAKNSGKFSPKWEGPYEVTESLGNGAYKLRDCNGELLS